MNLFRGKGWPDKSSVPVPPKERCAPQSRRGLMTASVGGLPDLPPSLYPSHTRSPTITRPSVDQPLTLPAIREFRLWEANFSSSCKAMPNFGPIFSRGTARKMNSLDFHCYFNFKAVWCSVFGAIDPSAPPTLLQPSVRHPQFICDQKALARRVD